MKRLFAVPWLFAAFVLTAVPLMPAAAMSVEDAPAVHALHLPDLISFDVLVDATADIAIAESKRHAIRASAHDIPETHAKILAVAQHNLRKSAVDDRRPARRWLI